MSSYYDLFPTRSCVLQTHEQIAHTTSWSIINFSMFFLQENIALIENTHVKPKLTQIFVVDFCYPLRS